MDKETADRQADRRKIGRPSNISLNLTAAIEPLFTKWSDTKDLNLSQSLLPSIYLLSFVDAFFFLPQSPFQSIVNHQR